jgi:hypothetical protein
MTARRARAEQARRDGLRIYFAGGRSAAGEASGAARTAAVSAARRSAPSPGSAADLTHALVSDQRRNAS